MKAGIGKASEFVEFKELKRKSATALAAAWKAAKKPDLPLIERVSNTFILSSQVIIYVPLNIQQDQSLS